MLNLAIAMIELSKGGITRGGKKSSFIPCMAWELSLLTYYEYFE